MSEISEMSGATGRGVENAANGVHAAINKAATAAQPVVDRIADDVHAAVNRVADAATHAAESMDTRRGQLRDAQTRMTASCRAYVREQPIMALGIAVAAGVTISWLLRRH